MPRDRPLLVLLTVDTEVWTPGLRCDPASVRAALDTWIEGRTPVGAYGLRHQLRLFHRYGLKAVFFVEALCADAIGLCALHRVVAPILAAGHEVQLHLHPEWLSAMTNPPFRPRGGRMTAYTEEEQRWLIDRGRHLLAACGARDVSALRTGHLSADRTTLRAAAAAGMRWDSSMGTGGALQPTRTEGLTEVPLTWFEDGLDGRHLARVGECPWNELTDTMHLAQAMGWHTYTLQSHTFELLNRARSLPNPVLVARLGRLCSLLARRRRHFPTVGFNDLDADEITRPVHSPPLRATALQSVGHRLSQAAASLLG